MYDPGAVPTKAQRLFYGIKKAPVVNTTGAWGVWCYKK